MSSRYFKDMFELADTELDLSKVRDKLNQVNPTYLSIRDFIETIMTPGLSVVRGVAQTAEKPRLPKSPNNYYSESAEISHRVNDLQQLSADLLQMGYKRFIFAADEGITNSDSGIVDLFSKGNEWEFFGLNWEKFCETNDKLEFLTSAGFNGLYEAAKKYAKSNGRNEVGLCDLFADRSGLTLYAIKDHLVLQITLDTRANCHEVNLRKPINGIIRIGGYDDEDKYKELADTFSGMRQRKYEIIVGELLSSDAREYGATLSIK